MNQDSKLALAIILASIGVMGYGALFATMTYQFTKSQEIRHLMARRAGGENVYYTRKNQRNVIKWTLIQLPYLWIIFILTSETGSNCHSKVPHELVPPKEVA